MVPWPVWAQYALAQVTEWTMKVPLVAKAQVRMLAEGVTDAAPPAASVPDDLRPRRMFTAEQIRERAARARRVRVEGSAGQRLRDWEDAPSLLRRHGRRPAHRLAEAHGDQGTGAEDPRKHDQLESTGLDR